MIDKLVQYVLEEIAMDGDEGSDMNRLTSFIREASTEALADSTLASTSKRTVVDDAFVSYLWSLLITQDDVHVGVIEEAGQQYRGEAGDDDSAEGRPAAPAMEEATRSHVGSPAPGTATPTTTGESKSRSKKGKTKAEAAGPTHVMRIIDKPGSREQLLAQHGSNLRIVVGADTAWAAITGSSTRPSSLTPNVYSTLQIVSRGRGAGATVVEIGKALNYDQKSAFHFVKTAVQLGIVKKFRTIDRGSWTNRIVHVRYLHKSKEWLIHNMNEPNDDEDEAPKVEDDDEPVEARSAATRMSAIGQYHINANPLMVKKRIVRALKKRDNFFMPHNQVAPSIGLNHYNRQVLRRFNSLITTMADDGIIEKIRVSDRSKRGVVETQVSCVRLLDMNADATGARQGGTHFFDDDEQEPEDDDSPHALTLVPIDRQILELIAESGAEGMTCAELSYLLGSYNQRTIDQTVTRLTRTTLIPDQLKDYSVELMTETVGREKRSRFFNRAGYVARCRQDGVDLDESEFALDENTVGSWQPVEECHADIQAKKTWTGQFNVKTGGKVKTVGGSFARQARDGLWQKTGVARVAPTGLSRSRSTHTASEDKSKPSKPKKTKAKTTEADHVDSQAGSTSAQGKRREASEEDEHEKPIGRPRKRPRVEGVLTYYEAQKLEAAERERLGMLPKQKGWTREERAKDTAEFEKRKREDRIKRGLPPEEPKLKVEARSLGSRETTNATNANQKKGAKRGKKQAKSRQRNDSDDSQEKLTDDHGEKAVVDSKDTDESEDEDDAIAAALFTSTRKLGESSTAKAEERRRSGGARQAVGRSSKASLPTSTQSAAITPSPDAGGSGKRRPRRSVAVSAVVDSPEAEDEDDEVIVVETVDNPVSERRSTRSKDSPITPVKLGPASQNRKRDRTGVAAAIDSTTEAPAVESPALPVTLTASPPQPLKKQRVDFTVDVPAPRSPKKQNEQNAQGTVQDSTLRLIEIEQTAAASAESGKSALIVQRRTTGSALETAVEERATSSAPGQASSNEHEPRIPMGKQNLASNASRSQPSKSINANSRVNLVVSKRRDEILAYLEHAGGITENYYQLRVIIKQFIDAERPSTDEPRTMMDRKTFLSVVNTLVDRGTLKRLVVQAGAASARVEILYLPSIDVDGPEMRAFLAKLSARKDPSRKARAPQIPRSQSMRQAPELQLEAHVRTAGASLTNDVDHLVDLSEVPNADDDRDAVRDYFRNQTGILGARFGVFYGRYARARHLHKWLLDHFYLLESDRDEVKSDYVISTGPSRIFAAELLESEITLGDYMRIIPLPVQSEELDEFVNDEDNLTEPLKDLPRSILSIVAPRSAKRRGALWVTIKAMLDLQLIAPLAHDADLLDETVTADSLKTPKRIEFATHWSLVRTVPIYRFSVKDAPLMEVITLNDPNDALNFWNRIEKFAFPSNVSSKPITDEEEAGGFSLTSDKSALFKTQISSTTKWYDAYMLLTPQRRYLARLRRRRPFLADEQEGLAQVADDLLAPLDVVEAFWQQLDLANRNRQRASGKSRQHGRRRRRSARDRGASGRRSQLGRRSTGRKTADDVGSDKEGHWSAASDNDDDGDNSDSEAARMDPRKAVKLKASDAGAQRQRDFEALLQHFRKSHGNPELEPEILAYVKQRFCAGGRHGIDLKQVEQEFRILLPSTNPDHLNVTEVKSVVPSSHVRSIQMLKDPYVLPAPIAPRARRRGAKPKPAIAAEVPRAIASARSGTSSAGGEAVDQPSDPHRFAGNPQNEFLSVPARDVPQIGAGQRLPRNILTEEQVDLLFDCCAIIYARAQRYEKRLLFTALQQIFPAPEPSKLRSAFLRRCELSPTDKAYFDRLIASWSQVWVEQGHELVDTNPTDLVDFDLAAFVRFLRSHIDKRALRLGAPVVAPVATIKLPDSIDELNTSFRIDTSIASTSTVDRWNDYWPRHPLASIVREQAAATTPFASPNVKWDSVDSASSELRLTKAQTLLKMVLATPQSSYSEDLAMKVLSPFDDIIPKVVARMTKQQIIMRRFKEASRRGPGRNFSFAEKYFNAFDDIVSPIKLLEAQTAEEEIAEEESMILPLDLSEGAMMSIVRLVSHDLAEFEVDTSITTELRDPDDYQTRSKDDEAIECSVQITPRTAATLAHPPSNVDHEAKPLLLPRSGTSDDAEQLQQARRKVEELAGEDQAALRLLEVLIGAGEQGLTVSSIKSRLAYARTSTKLDQLVQSLTSSSPPLVFKAGLREPTLVAAQYLDHWCVRLPTVTAMKREENGIAEESIDEESSNDFMFPVVWIDIRGQIVMNFALRAMAWVRGILSTHPRSTIAYVAAEAREAYLLTFVEVMVVLETLEQLGFIERTHFGNFDDVVPTWDEARWSLTEKWF